MAAGEATFTSCGRGHFRTARSGSGPERSGYRAGQRPRCGITGRQARYRSIYIGNGKMVHAPPTGENVQVVAADTTVDFVGAVRVDPGIAAALAG